MHVSNMSVEQRGVGIFVLQEHCFKSYLTLLLETKLCAYARIFYGLYLCTISKASE